MRHLPAFALGLAILVGCAVAPDPAPVAPTTTAPAPVALQEDDPGWDCRTMGNLQCGPDAEWGAFVVCFDEWRADPAGVTLTEAQTECSEESGWEVVAP